MVSGNIYNITCTMSLGFSPDFAKPALKFEITHKSDFFLPLFLAMAFYGNKLKTEKEQV